jgi:hypothetical protein
LTSFANHQDVDWPFLTVPDFQYRSHDYLKISGAELIAFSPLVSAIDMEAYVNYTTQNQDWIEEGRTTYFEDDIRSTGIVATDATGTMTPLLPIREMIWKYSLGTSNPIPDLQGSSSLLPLWQMFPSPQDTSVVNYNLRSNHLFDRGISLSETSQKTVLSEIFLQTELSVLDDSLNFDIPKSLVIQPVFESFDPQASVAGFLLVVVPWNIFFESVLGEGSHPIVCVVRTSCRNTAFSYRVEGPHATFLGKEDLHDPKFDALAVQMLFPDFDQNNFIAKSVTNYCEYSLTIYPTDTFQAEYQNTRALINMAVVLSVCVLTSALFLIYDLLVQRLKHKVVKQAQRSNAIVNR